MSDASRPDEADGPPVIDPDVIPVRVVNGVASIGYFGSLFDIMFTTNFLGTDEYGVLQQQRTVAARLRFDVEFARAFHAHLGQMLDALATPPKDKVN